jgi:hypothetical protein
VDSVERDLVVDVGQRPVRCLHRYIYTIVSVSVI